MRKRGRKGGRMEPDFTRPYTIKELLGKVVKLMNSDGKILEKKKSVDHIKPFKRDTLAPVVKQEKESPENSDTSSPCLKRRTSVIQSSSKTQDDAMKFKIFGLPKMKALRKQLWVRTSSMSRLSIHCVELSGLLMRSLMHSFGISSQSIDYRFTRCVHVLQHHYVWKKSIDWERCHFR